MPSVLFTAMLLHVFTRYELAHGAAAGVGSAAPAGLKYSLNVIVPG